MTWLITAFGALITALGLVGLWQPDSFRSIFRAVNSDTRFTLAIVVRLALGALFWWLAEDLRHPAIMRILAAIALFAAVGLLIMGRERLDRLVDWWLSRSDGLLRLWALLAAAFGAYLVFVAV
jgi:multisubunit Na+/H+ antiporter MnhG subunit